MKIEYYFLDHEDGESSKLYTITTKSKNYVSHNKKTVTIKVYIDDVFSGISFGEVERTYPRKGYKQEFIHKRNCLTKEKPVVKSWVTKSMRKALEKQFPGISKTKPLF